MGWILFDGVEGNGAVVTAVPLSLPCPKAPFGKQEKEQEQGKMNS